MSYYLKGARASMSTALRAVERRSVSMPRGAERVAAVASSNTSRPVVKLPASADATARPAPKVAPILEKLETVCLNLQKYDPWTGQYIADAGKQLNDAFGEPAERLVPLFAELFATKDLHAMYAERRVSLGMQAQAASHAASFLDDTMEAINKQMQQQGRVVSPLPHFEALGFGPARLELHAAHVLQERFAEQRNACADEANTARTILASLEPTAGPKRIVEVALASKVEELEMEILRCLRELRSLNEVPLNAAVQANNA